MVDKKILREERKKLRAELREINKKLNIEKKVKDRINKKIINCEINKQKIMGGKK